MSSSTPLYCRLLFTAVAAHLASGVQVRDILRSGIWHQPRPEGHHFLTHHELSNITSIACLEARQRDPTISCAGEEIVGHFGAQSASEAFQGPLSAGNYPHWEAPECHMETPGYMCDPTQALTLQERADIQSELQSLRYDVPVQCGSLQNDPAQERHLQPFYLGVALATEWPINQQDPASLQWLGESLVARWNMDHLYTGSYRPYAMCPNSAMLIILPDSRQAYLASESCEFVCMERGGPEVVSSILAALDRQGTAEAVRAGIREVYRVLQHTDPVSDTPYQAPTGHGPSLGLMNFLQRMVFVLAVLALIGSLVVAFAVLLLAPGLVGRLGKRV